MASSRNPRASFRSSFRVFENGAEKNPDLPSYFQEEEPFETQIGASFNIGHFRNDFDFSSSKGLPIHEGPTLSLQQIVQFQAMIRGHLERRRHGKSNRAIILLQALARRFLRKKQFIFLLKSTVICQSTARGYLIRKEGNRLEHIRNPPHIRKMRNQIAAIQMKLDAINEEREMVDIQRERRKAEIREEVRQKIAAEERNKSLGISQVKSTGSQLISYLRTENNALRATMKGLAQDIADIRSDNEWLEKDTQTIAQYTHVLHGHYLKMKTANGALQRKATKLRKCMPKWGDALVERRNYASNEARQKYLYRQGVFKIMDTLCLDQSCNSAVKDGLFKMIRNCEYEFDFELDLDTPLHLFPTAPDSDPVFLDYFSEEEGIPLGECDQQDFEWMDDSKFILTELPAMTDDHAQSFLDDETASASSESNYCDSQSINSSGSSWNHSESSSSSCSASSSDCESVLSAKSSLPEKLCHSGQSISEHIDMKIDPPLSPIINRNPSICEEVSTSSSTACSTKSAFEVASVVSIHYEPHSSDETHCKASKQAGGQSVADSNNDDVPAQSNQKPDWKAETGRDDDSMKYPCVITVTSKTDMDWKINGPGDSHTLASTTCTTAMESDCTSNFSEEDLHYQHEELDKSVFGLMLPPGEAADDNSEFVSLDTGIESVFEVESQAGEDRSIRTDFMEATGDADFNHSLVVGEQKETNTFSKRVDAQTSEESVVKKSSKGTTPSMRGPQTKQSPLTLPIIHAQPPRKIPEPTIPVKARHPATRTSKPQSSVEKPKPFHARPAPKSNCPSIPVRQRDPSKLRSTFRARPAPKRATPKIPVRDRNPSELRSAA